MGGNKITSLGDPTEDTDAIRGQEVFLIKEFIQLIKI